MASAVALPLEKQFATIAGLNSINSTSSQGSTNITLQFDLSRNIDAAAQDVQSMIAQDGAPAAAADAGAAVVPEGEPGRPAGDVPGAALGDAAAVDGRRVRRVDDRAAHLDGERRRAGATSSAPRSTPCASTSIRASWRRTASASTKSPTAITNANVNLPTGTMYGAGQDVHRPGQRPAAAAPRRTGR